MHYQCLLRQLINYKDEHGKIEITSYSVETGHSQRGGKLVIMVVCEIKVGWRVS